MIRVDSLKGNALALLKLNFQPTRLEALSFVVSCLPAREGFLWQAILARTYVIHFSPPLLCLASCLQQSEQRGSADLYANICLAGLFVT